MSTTQDLPAHVLVVDDDEFARDAVSLLLEQRRYRVSVCEDALQAICRLHAGLKPDVIVLDLLMPGMSGWEFRILQKANRNWAHIPVIAVSADKSAKAAAIDAEAFLPKPLSDRSLLEMVERVSSAGLRARGRDDDASLARLRDLGNLAGGIADQLSPSLAALTENLRLAERQSAEMQTRIAKTEAFSLLGARQLVQSALRHGERIRQALAGVSAFSELALHTLQRQRRVLIAHTDARLSVLLREALGEESQVLMVRSAGEASEALSQDSFDVFLCELSLPDASGIDLYTLLLSRRSEQAKRMVFLTPAGNFDEREREFFARYRPWQLRIPFSASDVRELIELHLREFH